MKLTLPTTLKRRAAGSRQDARLKNAIVDKRKRIVKRPILDQAFTPVDPGPGLGLYVRDDTDIIAITGNTLTTNPGGTTKKLSYSVQPSKSSISTTISPSVTVQAKTLFGSLLGTWLGSPPADEVSTVRISLSTNPTGASLVGTVTTVVTGNVATFSNLRITRSGEGFKLRATAFNVSSAISVAFDIPTRLTFTVQPADTAPNSTMAAIQVTAKDTAGNTDTQYTGAITLDTYSGGSGLSGTTTVAAVVGIASFTNIQFTTTGTFRLRAKGAKVATAYPPAQVSSNSFSISNATHTLVAVDLNPPFLSEVGFTIDGPLGSILATTLNAATIRALYSFLWPNFQSYTNFSVSTVTAQSFFTSVTIGSKTLYASSAAFSNPGGNSVWAWGGASGNEPAFELVPATGTYGVTFV